MLHRLTTSPWIAVLLVVAACANVPREQEHDLSALRSAVAQRVGLETPVEAPVSEPELARELERLLAEPLDDATAVRIALLANPRMRALYAELEVASAERVQAGRVRNPVVSGDLLFFGDGLEAELSIVQPFLDLLRAPLRRRIAAAEYAAAETEVGRRLVELVFDVRRALVDVRAAQESVLLARAAFDTARSGHELMQALHAAGNVGDPALSAQEAELSRARLDLMAAEAAERESREPLSVLLGLDRADGAWTVGGALGDPPEPPLGREALEEGALAASFDLAATRARIEAARADVRLADQRRALPDAELGVTAKKESGKSDWGLGPTLGLELPIADGGDARAAGARGRLRLELERERALVIEIRSAARTAWLQLDAAGDRLEILREHHLPVHRRLVTELLRTYNAMQIGVFPVLDARRAELDAQRERLEARVAAARARTDMEELLDGALHGANAVEEVGAADASGARSGLGTMHTGGH